MESIPFVSAARVAEVLKYPELIEAMQSALGKFSRSDTSVVQPVRLVVPIREQDGWLGLMPGYSPEDNALATKLVTFYPRNKTVPTHHAIIAVFDPATGVPRAIVDGELITAMRTAAVSAVATKFLAKENPEILAILGAGVQARSHYRALSSLFTFKEVRVWGRTAAKAESLAAEVGARACLSVQEAVRDADVIVTVTASPTPVLQLSWVKPGVHINAVGACRPDWHEIDPELMRKATVYVCSQDAAKKESGDVILAKADIYAELGEVINGTKTASRDDTTVFKSLGMAIEDVMSAKLVLDKIADSKI